MMTDNIEEILYSFGYRVTSMEMDLGSQEPLRCHLNAEGHSGSPCTDTKEIITELENRGFTCENISCRKEIDTYEEWTIGSRLPEIIKGQTHYILNVTILPTKMLIVNGLPQVVPVEDNTFNLSGAL